MVAAPADMLHWNTGRLTRLGSRLRSEFERHRTEIIRHNRTVRVALRNHQGLGIERVMNSRADDLRVSTGTAPTDGRSDLDDRRTHAPRRLFRVTL